MPGGAELRGGAGLNRVGSQGGVMGGRSLSGTLLGVFKVFSWFLSSPDVGLGGCVLVTRSPGVVGNGEREGVGQTAWRPPQCPLQSSWVPYNRPTAPTTVPYPHQQSHDSYNRPGPPTTVLGPLQLSLVPYNRPTSPTVNLCPLQLYWVPYSHPAAPQLPLQSQLPYSRLISAPVNLGPLQPSHVPHNPPVSP